MPQSNAPILSQTVRWAENYVSRALNIKNAGIIPAGIYHGYEVRPAGKMAVLIEHDASYPKSVAVVERDGYSLTILMEDAGIVEIPAPGEWFICIEAWYAPTKQGYQRIVAREKAEMHHVILASVTVPEDQYIITQEMIDYGTRNFLRQIPDIINDFNVQIVRNLTSVIQLSDRLTCESLKRIELENGLFASECREAKNMGYFISLADRITNLEMAFYGSNHGENTAPAAIMTASGYRDYGGAVVSPVSIVSNNARTPLGASLVLKLEEI